MRSRGAAALTIAVVAVAPRVLQRPEIRRAETALLARVVSSRSPQWRGPTSTVTGLAEPLPVGVAAGVAAGWAALRGTAPRAICRRVSIAVTGVAVRRGLAEMIRRDRPPTGWWWDTPSGYSYPSRHVAWAVLGGGLVADLLASDDGGSPPSAVTAGSAATIGATRLVLAVHWPSDVVAAWAFAAAWRRLWRPAQRRLHG